MNPRFNYSTQAATASPLPFREIVRKGGYDFIDFGCSKGGSLKWGQREFVAVRGLGIDISEKKVLEARRNGFDAIVYDILDIDAEKMVDFTTMLHFLEHVPDLISVQQFIRRACEISRRFVLVRQPYFGADDYLLTLGLKLYWSHWRGHPNTMSALDFYRVLSSLKSEGHLQNYSIHASGSILSSDDPTIHPLESPIDQHAYAEIKHPRKPKGIVFEIPVYRELIVVVDIDGESSEHVKKALKITADIYP